jgi:hypothetical protein
LTKNPLRVTNSPASRLGTALVALLFVLGGGVPTAAACMPGMMSAKHCGQMADGRHCDGERGAASAVCVSHHASQDLRMVPGPTVDPPVAGASSGLVRAPTLGDRIVTSNLLSRRVVDRAVCCRAHVGVWLE